jgi:hypothetical protein
LPDQAEMLQQIVQVAETANLSFGEDLWLIAERIMLYRLTRAGDQKRIELASMVHLLKRIISETQGDQNIPPELAELDASAANSFKGSADANLSIVFTTVVDLAESMNEDQLYLLISALRKLELPDPEVIDTEPLEKAEEFLHEGFEQEEDEWGI